MQAESRTKTHSSYSSLGTTFTLPTLFAKGFHNIQTNLVIALFYNNGCNSNYIIRVQKIGLVKSKSCEMVISGTFSSYGHHGSTHLRICYSN